MTQADLDPPPARGPAPSTGTATAGSPQGVGAPGRARIAARTLRTDRWWFEPALTFTLLTLWLLYALVRTASQRAYFVEEYHYLSPFSSPCVSASCIPAARDFGTWFGEFPPFIPFALLVLPFLLGFRLTCYYYRKAYYRAFWLSPPACAVAEPHAKYTGETRFPLVMQNIHRYFFYAAIVVSLVNTYDALKAFHGRDGGFGIGLGTLFRFWAYRQFVFRGEHVGEPEPEGQEVTTPSVPAGDEETPRAS